MHDQGTAATGLKPSSPQELIVVTSSPPLQQNVCFGVFRKLEEAQDKLWEQQDGFHHSGLAAGLEPCLPGCFVQAAFCSFSNGELKKLNCFCKRIWPAATTSSLLRFHALSRLHYELTVFTLGKSRI